MLGKFRRGEVHLRATWIFTRVDVIADIGLLVSAIGILVTGIRFIDLAGAAAIGAYVIKDAIEILKEFRRILAAKTESSKFDRYVFPQLPYAAHLRGRRRDVTRCT